MLWNGNRQMINKIIKFFKILEKYIKVNKFKKKFNKLKNKKIK